MGSKRKRTAGLPPTSSIVFPEHCGCVAQDAVQLLESPITTLPAASATEFLQKQLAALDKLFAVYKVEYYATLEELHACHTAFALSGAAATTVSTETAHNAASQKGSIPATLREMLAQDHSRAPQLSFQAAPSPLHHSPTPPHSPSPTKRAETALPNFANSSPPGHASRSSPAAARPPTPIRCVTPPPASTLELPPSPPRTSGSASLLCHGASAPGLSLDSGAGAGVASLGHWGAGAGANKPAVGTPQSVNKAGMGSAELCDNAASRHGLGHSSRTQSASLLVHAASALLTPAKAGAGPAAQARAGSDAGTSSGAVAEHSKLGPLKQLPPLPPAPANTKATSQGTAAAQPPAPAGQPLLPASGAAAADPRQPGWLFAGGEYGDEVLGYGSDSDPATFSDAEDIILGLPALLPDTPQPLQTSSITALAAAAVPVAAAAAAAGGPALGVPGACELGAADQPNLTALATRPAVVTRQATASSPLLPPAIPTPDPATTTAAPAAAVDSSHTAAANAQLQPSQPPAAGAAGEEVEEARDGSRGTSAAGATGSGGAAPEGGCYPCCLGESEGVKVSAPTTVGQTELAAGPTVRVLLPPPHPQQVQAWRMRFATQLPVLLQLEALASACTEQGEAFSLTINSNATTNSTNSTKLRGWFTVRQAWGAMPVPQADVLAGHALQKGKGEVDVELGEAGPATKVSRRQAYLVLGPDGSFVLHNTGRRPLHVDGQLLQQFDSCLLQQLSLVEVAGLQLLFMINTAAVARVLRRTSRAVSGATAAAAVAGAATAAGTVDTAAAAVA
ncbi:hypothetical protein QJQ45_001761 [Haematococcus lacustris]|nr:hypothetical protein QJQ45_001761 [Haematococcus lacustris]